jgi:hypothetical protein
MSRKLLSIGNLKGWTHRLKLRFELKEVVSEMARMLQWDFTVVYAAPPNTYEAVNAD